MTRLLRNRRLLLTITSVVAALWISAPGPARAQTDTVSPEIVTADPPAHVSVVDGAAVLERDGQPDAAPTNMPLLAGDRLRTQNGRVEILFADGSTLHLDANTTLDFQSDELVRLLDGRIRLSIPGRDQRVSYRVDTASGSAIILRPGEYRLAVLHNTRDGEIELAVIRGAAELVNEDGRTELRAGERAYARASGAPSNAYVFNSASWDSFDRWSEARRDERLGVSTQYLPDEVRTYAPSFDRYGAWQYDVSYGYVWYPRVAADWRPYYSGRWITMRPYGWTWVGIDSWSWPTHHSGRWGISAGSWFWIPGRSWAPAWVSWAYAPGYVSWCPLGWNNRPVLQILHAGGYGRGSDPWRAWTAVPRNHFGVDYVNTHYVAGRTFDVRTRDSFVQRSAPDVRGYAVPRSSAPIRVAGTVTRRSDSPVYTNLEPGAARVGAGGPRVVVGQPRRTVAAPADESGVDRPRATTRDMPIERNPMDRSRPASAYPPYAGREAAVPRAAAPRVDPYRAPGTADRSYDANNRSSSDPRGGSDPAPRYGSYPYSRRAPDQDPGVTPRGAIDRRGGQEAGRPMPESRPYGAAVPRGPEAGRSAPEYRPGGNAAPPEAPRPGAPQDRPSGGIERRGPERSSPPPESARPAPREYHANPGADRGAPPPADRGTPAPANRGNQAQPRSGGRGGR